MALNAYRVILFGVSIALLHPVPTEPAWAGLMALWAAIFLVPIGIAQTTLRNPVFSIEPVLVKIQPIAATLLSLSFWIEQGVLSGILATFYLLWCVAVVLPHLLSYFFRPDFSLPFVSLLAAWGFLTNAALWLVFDRFDVQPFGFSAWIVLLTGAHFHYAGFALMLAIALLLQQNPTDKWVKMASYAILCGVVFTAIGITTTQLGLPHWIETLAGSVMALSATGAGIVFIRASRREVGVTRWLWFCGGLSLFATMLLAFLYALRPIFSLFWLNMPLMQAVHGSINALGFGTLMLLGWRFKS